MYQGYKAACDKCESQILTMLHRQCKTTEVVVEIKKIKIKNKNKNTDVTPKVLWSSYVT